MKAWSDSDGWIDIDIVWSGASREPIPGIGAQERRGSYLCQSSNRGADTTHEKQERKARRVRCACGNLMKLTPDSRTSKCWKCREAHQITVWKKGPYRRRAA